MKAGSEIKAGSHLNKTLRNKVSFKKTPPKVGFSKGKGTQDPFKEQITEITIENESVKPLSVKKKRKPRLEASGDVSSTTRKPLLRGFRFNTKKKNS